MYFVNEVLKKIHIVCFFVCEKIIKYKVWILVKVCLEVDKYGFDEVSNTWSGGLREVVAYGRLHGCPRKFVVAGRLCG